MKWLIIISLGLLGIGALGALAYYELANPFLVGIPIFLAVACAVAWKLGFFKKVRNVKQTLKSEPLNTRDGIRIAVVISLIFLAILADPIVGALLIGIPLVLIILLFALPYAPGLVAKLSNDPNEFREQPETTAEMSRVEKAKLEASVGSYEASTNALFSFIKPGRIKAIIRGQRFIRFIMRYDSKTFSGDLKRGTAEEIPMNRREYWNVEDTPSDAVDSHPIPHSLRNGKFDLLWLWSRHVYDLTGGVFTGIPPFQTVEVYNLELLIKVLGSEAGSEGEFVLIPYKDFSDHVRAAQFQFFVQVPGAETKDQVKVRLQFALTIVVTNPYKAFYDTDNKWAARLFTAVVQEVSAKVRELPYQDVIAAEKGTKSARNPLLKPILSLNSSAQRAGGRAAQDSLDAIGLRIDGVELIDAEVTSKELAIALSDIARAQADKEARMLRADGDEYAVDIVAAAAKKHGEYGRIALMVDGNVRTATAATKDGGDVILNIDSARGEQVDPRTTFLKNSISGGGSE